MQLERSSSTGSYEGSTSSLTQSSSAVERSADLPPELKELIGVRGKEYWRNNNSTQRKWMYVRDFQTPRALQTAPGRIYEALFAHNKESGDAPVTAVPVAGYKPQPLPRHMRCFPCFFRRARRRRLTEEYAQSFSLSDITTAKTAEIALRVSKAAQGEPEIFERDGAYFLRIRPGMRITDLDEYLLKKGFVLPENMPTLNMASFIGAAANGCYGPGFGPMTDNIVEIKGFDATGEPLTLSAEENPELFSILRDCHLGTFFVTEVTIANIKPKYVLKRHHRLLEDVSAFADALKRQEWMMDGNPFIFMYVPVDIDEEGGHFPRIRVTTVEPADEPPPRHHRSDQRELIDYLNLHVGEAGEPLIDLMTRSKTLRQFFPFVLKTAAIKTYGCDRETEEVDWAPYMLHVFRTYTDLPITDINWLIQVDSPENGRELLLELIAMVEEKLKSYAEKEKYPLFNAFARYLKGIYYPEGEGGIAPCAIDREDQSILSFELLTYGGLSDTKEFKDLVDSVVHILEARGHKYTYHPGKHWPDGVRSLTQIFRDAIGQQRLANFHRAVAQLHHGEENLPFSPTLTPRKKEFIGLEPPKEEGRSLPRPGCTRQQKREALRKIARLAEEEGDSAVATKALQKIQ